jgi:lipid-binding SYLF domain-containing protein
MHAKILSYSRARGVFAGIALTGATLRQDLDQNAEMYGKPISNEDVVSSKPKPPAGATELLAVLGKYPPAGK